MFFLSNLQTAHRETIISHHRTSGEIDAGAFHDPDLNLRTNNEVEACRLPHRSQWTGTSPVPPPNDTALANATGQISQRVPQGEIPMPLALIVAQAVNAVMPMINHLSMSHHAQHQERVKAWVTLLRTRLNHIDDAKTLFGIALRLQRLGETVALHSDILTSERDLEALRATSIVVENLKREASRD